MWDAYQKIVFHLNADVFQFITREVAVESLRLQPFAGNIAFFGNAKYSRMDCSIPSETGNKHVRDVY
jgi:hypothetical protein